MTKKNVGWMADTIAIQDLPDSCLPACFPMQIMAKVAQDRPIVKASAMLKLEPAVTQVWLVD